MILNVSRGPMPKFGLVTSTDGGASFSHYHRIAITHRLVSHDMYIARGRGDLILSGNFMAGPSFAVAPPESPFADRLFAAWQDIPSDGTSRIFLAWSSDRGSTWSSPVQMDAAASQTIRQGVPMVVASKQGVLGVAWFDGRLAPDNHGYDVYFTASMDGGLSFQPAIRVSTATSIPARGQNIAPAVNVSTPTPDGTVAVQMSAPYSQRATGADYSTMAVDALGRFHPLWPDARGKSWQLYTATIHVFTGESLRQLSATPTNRTAAADTPCPNESNSIEPIFGEAKWNAETTKPSCLYGS